ncbi:MAG: efflux RND transporter periplasmic adaptor subunit, partial [Burkholderiales bacterium]
LVFLAVAAVGLGLAGWYGYRLQQGEPPAGLAWLGGSSTGADVRGDVLRVGAPDAGPGAPGSGARERAGAAGVGQPGAAPAKGGGRGPGGPPGARGPLPVEVAAVEAETISDDVSAVGTLRARESVVVRPEIAGRITRIGFSDGGRVARGALLVGLDDTIPAAEVEQARAEVELSRANFQRTEDLARRKFVSGRALDEAAANLKVVAARFQLAQARLAKSSIHAPFTGVVGLRNISVGDYVREGAELAVLEDTSSMKVDLRVPERLLGSIEVGQALEVEVDALPGQRFRASIEAIDVQVDVNGRSVIVRGRIPNPKAVLRSGMFARARIVLETRANALVVPEEAVELTDSGAVVFRVFEGKAMRTPVRTGVQRGGKIEIRQGLQVGDRVVTAGQLKLRGDAMPVQVVQPAGTGRVPAAAGGPAQRPGSGGVGAPDAPAANPRG